MSPILSVADVWKTYHRKKEADTSVLRGASLRVEPGEVVALMGPSGAGKSTLLHIMATIDMPDTGVVQYHMNGTTMNTSGMNAASLATLRAHHIGVIFQFHHLLPEFTALENVVIPGLIAGVPRVQAEKKALELLERVGMSSRGSHLPTEMSGGEQQRVAIARALVNNPKVVFADEPTGNLDTNNAENVADLLFALRNEMGMACVVATHSMELAARAHRIVQITNGCCYEERRG